MSYQVTARKWRPQTFDEVVGQQHITTTLKNSLENKRVAHAFIFAGPRGVGKTTTARILAKSLNCLDLQKSEPCNKCEMCKSFLASQSLDIIEIDGASNRRIDEIRTLRESVKYAPTVGSYKIYIIDEVHMLTTESFNALLKTLEEPPEHTIFIFATTDVHKVPPTIISRCQRFDFRRIELNDIKTLLKKIADAEKIKIDDQSLSLIAKKADGALRDAQSLFDQVISFCGDKINSDVISKMLNLIDEEIYFKISDAILNKNFSAAFEVTKEIYDKGWNFVDFVNGLIEHFRNVMTVVIRKNTDLIETSEVFRGKYNSYSGSFNEGDLIRILGFLNKIQYELKSTQNEKLKIEIALAHLIGLERSSTISSLLTEIKSIKISPKSDESPSSTPLNQFDSSKKKITLEPKQNNISLKKDVVSEKFDLDFIRSKWDEFVEEVNKEKFTLGSHILDSSPVNYDSNLLELSFPNLDDIEIIKDNPSYISCIKKTAKKVYGHKIDFSFTEQKMRQSNSEQEAKGLESKTASSSEAKLKDTPLIKAIKKELGGRELSNT
jgi:DNA polymerase-3 subunit gamma/tau